MSSLNSLESRVGKFNVKESGRRDSGDKKYDLRMVYELGISKTSEI